MFLDRNRNVERTLCACHTVRTLLEEVVRTVAMAEIVELPRLGDSPAFANRLLIDEHFDRPIIPCKIASIDIRLCQLGRGDLDVVLSGFGRAVAKPLLEFDQCRRLFRIEELRGDGGPVDRALWLVILPRASFIGIPAFRQSIGMIEPSR